MILGDDMNPSSNDDRSVADQFHPKGTLERMAPVFASVFLAQRVGVARLNPGAERFENIALWDHERGAIEWDYPFASEGTAASWVVECACPIAGTKVP